MVKIVRTLMTLRGVTQSQLANHTGISMTAISRYLNDTSELRSDSLIKILQFLGADIDFLVKREINKALGNHDESSIEEDLRILLLNLDSISKRTMLDTLISSNKKNSTPEIKTAISRVKKYRDSIQTVRRMSC
jgi:transcriptional regulator with XRE-family HTH domain